MSEPAQPEAPAETTGTVEQPPEPQQNKDQPKPPWGEEGSFDAERAWALIQNLRGDNDKLKSDRDGWKKKVDDAETAKLTEQQRIQKERDDAVKAAAEAQTQMLRERVARRHNLPDELVGRLVGDDEDALVEDAKRLAELIKPDGPRQPRPDPTQGARGSSMPAQLGESELHRMTPEQINKARKEGRLNTLMGRASR